MARYEKPLRDVGVLSEKPDDESAIEEISQEELVSIRPGQRPSIESDEAGLWMVMDQAEEKLQTSGHIVRDKELNMYMKEIFCRLAPEYCDDIRIYLIRVPYFNAAMAPNGAMQIWTGLFLRIQNEAQLAAIIGHELGHYVRRHSLQMMRDVIDKAGALIFIQMATAIAGVSVAGDVAYAMTIGSIQAFSRNNEREADGYGLAFMSRADYDPREAGKVWHRLIEEEKANKENKKAPIFLASHPSSEERNKALQELSKRLANRDGTLAHGKERFLKHILPYRSEYLRDELHLRDYDRSEKLFEMLIEDGSKPAELHFFMGELYRLRGKEGDTKKALTEYEEAAQSPTPPTDVYRAMGLLYYKTGKRKEAVDAFSRYLELCYECSDRKMILHMIQEIER
jgi:predicted Zn-dependent protease